MEVKTLRILGIKTNNLGDTIKENHFELNYIEIHEALKISMELIDGIINEKYTFPYLKKRKEGD